VLAAELPEGLCGRPRPLGGAVVLAPSPEEVGEVGERLGFGFPVGH